MPELRCKVFDTSRDFANWCKQNGVLQHEDNYGYYHHTSIEKGYNAILTGVTQYNDLIDSVINQVRENVETPHKAWVSSVVGHRANVPAYLMGRPDSMYNLHEVTSEHDPVHVYVGISSSAGVTTEQLIKRGAAICAFAMALSEHRTVYITPYVSNGIHYKKTSVMAWQLRTSPIVLSEIAACLADPGVVRSLSLSACEVFDGVSNGNVYPNTDIPEIKRALNVKPADLFFEEFHLNDPLLTNPVQAVKRMLAKYIEEQE